MGIRNKLHGWNTENNNNKRQIDKYLASVPGWFRQDKYEFLPISNVFSSKPLRAVLDKGVTVEVCKYIRNQANKIERFESELKDVVG